MPFLYFSIRGCSLTPENPRIENVSRFCRQMRRSDQMEHISKQCTPVETSPGVVVEGRDQSPAPRRNLPAAVPSSLENQNTRAL